MNKKDKLINQKIEELQTITDRLGKPIDKGIIELVAVLNLLGFKTSGSCEGHLDHGCASPWVDIEGDIDKDELNKLATLQKEIDEIVRKKGFTTQAIKKQRGYRKRLDALIKPTKLKALKIIDLLNEFYDNRKIKVDERIIIAEGGISFRIICQGDYIQDVVSNKQKEKRLTKYQKEFNTFKYFSIDKLKT